MPGIRGTFRLLRERFMSDTQKFDQRAKRAEKKLDKNASRVERHLEKGRRKAPDQRLVRAHDSFKKVERFVNQYKDADLDEGQRARLKSIEQRLEVSHPERELAKAENRAWTGGLGMTRGKQRETFEAARESIDNSGALERMDIDGAFRRRFELAGLDRTAAETHDDYPRQLLRQLEVMGRAPQPDVEAIGALEAAYEAARTAQMGAPPEGRKALGAQQLDTLRALHTAPEGVPEQFAAFVAEKNRLADLVGDRFARLSQRHPRDGQFADPADSDLEPIWQDYVQLKTDIAAWLIAGESDSALQLALETAWADFPQLHDAEFWSMLSFTGAGVFGGKVLSDVEAAALAGTPAVDILADFIQRQCETYSVPLEALFDGGDAHAYAEQWLEGTDEVLLEAQNTLHAHNDALDRARIGLEDLLGETPSLDQLSRNIERLGANAFAEEVWADLDPALQPFRNLAERWSGLSGDEREARRVEFQGELNLLAMELRENGDLDVQDILDDTTAALDLGRAGETIATRARQVKACYAEGQGVEKLQAGLLAHHDAVVDARLDVSTGAAVAEVTGPGQDFCEDAYAARDFGDGTQFFLVADGHGKRAGADVAEAVADELPALVQTALASSADVSLAEGMRRATHAMQKRLVEDVSNYYDNDSLPDTSGGAATVMALVTDAELCVGSVGDSEAILCRGGKAMKLSRLRDKDDPTEAAALERRRQAQGWSAGEGYSKGTTASFGDIQVEHNASGEVVPHHLYDQQDFARNPTGTVPDIVTVPRQADDEFMVLGCDGIWDVMTPQAVVDFIRDGRAKGQTDEALAEILARIAQPIGRDDTTIMIVPLGAD